MLAQVANQVAARHLPVERRVVVETMIPIDLEAEKAQIELVRLGDVEDGRIGTTLMKWMAIEIPFSNHDRHREGPRA